jgi:hypothetical protein
MEIHGETGAIVIGDAMAQDTAGTVELHSGEGVEPIDVDVSEDLYQSMSAHLRPLYEVKAGRPPAGKMASAP